MIGGISGNAPLPAVPDSTRRPDVPSRQIPRAEPVSPERDGSGQETAEKGARVRRAEAGNEPETVRPRRTPDADNLPLRNQEALSAYDRIGSAAVAEDVELVGVDLRV